MSTLRNLKVIAVFRGFRGVTIGAAGVSLQALDTQNFSPRLDQFLDHLDMPVMRPVVQPFVHELAQVDHPLLYQIMVLCLLWASLLLVQSYGLWTGRRWSIWVALGTSAMVLSGFVWMLTPAAGPRAWLLLMVNALVAAYLLRLLFRRQR
ncbi:MAG: DUF2127 domain-containing protein [Limnohabitans sp.]|jgi:uncharacterized membrane protein (DUF2068 family)|nr:DUF2127 domain-containing protein [Limnohabitans sp.]